MKALKSNFTPSRLVLGVLPACAAMLLGGCSRNVTSAPVTTAASAPKTEIGATTSSSTNPDASVSVASKPFASKTSAPKTSASKSSKIKWLTDYDQALVEAKKIQKPVMLDFHAEWCAPCKVMDANIFPAKGVVQEAQHFVNVKIDIDKRPDLMQKYGLSGIPAIVFVDASGEVIYRPVFLTGDPVDFAEMMNSARARATPPPA